MSDKSYVKFLVKQGVSGGKGFELEIKLCKGDTKAELIQLGKDAINVGDEVIKEVPQ